MGRLYSYINRRGEYIRVEDEEKEATPSKDVASDYFKGVKPSDLSRLDNRQLYMAAERLHEGIVSGHGTDREKAGANEALNAVYRERKARRQTIR